MATVISTINLKGGVGKTQMTVALAEFLALEHNKKVLLVDLDPQTNATVSLISEEQWLEKDREGKTLFQLFKDKKDNTSTFSIHDAIVKRASNISGGIRNLDLLPSSLRLIELQDGLAQIPAGHFFVTSPVTILSESITNVADDYDFILVDCPPNLGIITLNGIYISDYYLIPTIPDILSTYGIPQIIDRINKFSSEAKKDISPLGIVISMYRAQSYLHRSTVEILKTKSTQQRYPRIFETVIPLTVRTAEAADYKAEVNTLRQKYGYTRAYENYHALATELLEYV